MKVLEEPLAGLTVVDLALGMPGGLAARLLADLGAQVLRAEPRSGDPFSTCYDAYSAWQSGKKIQRFETIRDAVKGLAEELSQADMCLIGGEDYPGLAWRPKAQALAEAYPRLIILDIGGGPAGTRDATVPAVEILAQARSGMVHEIYEDRPAVMGFPVASYGAAFEGLIGLTAALCARERDGAGQIVRTSMFEGTMAWMTHFWTLSERSDRSISYVPPKSAQQLIFACADGKYIHFTLGTTNARLNIYNLLGIDDPTVKDDPRGLPSMARGARNFFGDVDLLQEHVRRWRRDDLLAELWELGLPAEAVNAPGECWEDEQVIANAVLRRDPDGSERVGSPLQIEAADAPESSAGPIGAGGPPLSGIRVIDFGNFTAGPHASMPLADLGADVIKVESIEGDPIRVFFRPYAASSRGKRSIAIDLKTAEGRDMALRLCKSADIVHHNFRPGVMRRLGIDPETLRALRPDLILFENSGYGATGPKALRGGLDMIFQAFCGHEQRGAGAGRPPFGYRATTIDFAAGMLGTIGSLIMLYRRMRGGGGARVTTSLLSAGVYLMSELVRRPDGAFTSLPRLNAEETGFHPAEQLYRAADAWIAISARDSAMAKRLLAVLGLEARVTKARHEWGSAEQELIATAIAHRPAAAVLSALAAADVWAELCQEEAEVGVLRDPDYRRSGKVVSANYPLYGEVLQIGTLFSLSRSPMVSRAERAELGQHSRELLADLGYPAEEIERLIAAGVVKAAA